MTLGQSQKGVVMLFEPTIKWLKWFLIKNNYKAIADQIDDKWCWKELGEFSKKVPKKVLDLMAEEIKSTGGWECYKYCRHIEDRPDLREALITSGDWWARYWYCAFVEDRDDVRPPPNPEITTASPYVSA